MNRSYAFLDQQRQHGDAEADLLVKALFANQEQQLLYASFSKSLSIILAERNVVNDFLIAERPIPSWLEEKKITKGLTFYYRYAMPIMTLLGGLSLPYCYAGSPGNKALYLSEKMRKNTLKRVSDTADFVIAVCSPRTISAIENVRWQINKTRLIHAIARHHILSSGQWDSAWGYPINQEDQAGTNLAFSYIILSGLKRSGYLVSTQEEESYLHLWRYIGYLMHIDEALLPANFAEANLMERIIRKRNFKKSEEGLVLTKELLTFYKTAAPPSEAPLVEAQIRYWLGEEVSELLGVEKSSVNDLLVSSLNFFREAGNYKQSTKTSYTQMIENNNYLKSLRARS